MRTLVYGAAALVTVAADGTGSKRGPAMQDLRVLPNHSIIIENGLISEILLTQNIRPDQFERVIHAEGKTILPGLIDCHTHTIFAGSRANEFCLKLRGASYEEIANAGGGIAITMKATREATEIELLKVARKRVAFYKSLGVTAVEIKSGYGLNYDDELKILRSIKALQAEEPIELIPTFLGAHIVPPEFKGKRNEYISLITQALLPRIAEDKLAKFCDVFCEETAFTPVETEEIFTCAQRLGLSLKLHTDQFHSVGGLETGLRFGAVSVDHLEVLQKEQISALASADTVSVLLPGVSFFLKHEYAPARDLIDAGALVALATDFNPGSSHIPNIHFIMALAAIQMKMSIEETITAVTLNAAKALGIESTNGSIEIGKKADLAIFDTENYQDLIYTIGQNLNIMTIKNGIVVYEKKDTE